MQPISRERDRGLDIARAMSIYLVIVNHSEFADTIGQYAIFPKHQLLTDLINALNFFRMPLFFFVSGVLSARLMRLTVREAMAWRIVPLLYVYFLWTYFNFWAYGSAKETEWFGLITDEATLFVSSISWFENPTWFLFALPLYSALFIGLRRLPVWLQVGIGLAMSLSSTTILVDLANYTHKMLLQNYVVFAVGIHLASRMPVFRPVLQRWSTAILGVVGLLACLVAMRLFDLSAFSPLRWVATVCSVTFGLSFAAITANTIPGRIAAVFGRHTLEIYLLHQLGRFFVGFALASLGLFLPWWAVFPLAAVTMGVTYLMGLAAAKIPFLFAPPWSVKRRAVVPVETVEGVRVAEKTPA